MFNNIKKIFLAAMLVFVSSQTMAWSVIGHRVVGEIAETYLTKKAKKGIAEILGNESVAMASNWGDFVKSDPAYNYLYSWHYINFDSGLSDSTLYKYLAADTTTDAYTKINLCIQQLKNRAVMAPADKILYLKFLIHVIGDVHQPLHVGHQDDQGGNKVKVLWFSTPTNLHSVWDEKLVEFQELSYTEYAKAINFATKAQISQWQSNSVSDWIVESYHLASKLYGDITQPDQKLDYKYNYKYLDTLNQQLLKGGVRLAGVLNDIFG